MPAGRTPRRLASNCSSATSGIDPAVPVEAESAWTGDFHEPLATLFTVPSDWNFSDAACKGIDFICWPTVAPASIEVYARASGGVPGWNHSLLVPTLKRGSLYLLPLSADGKSLRGPIERYFQTENRYRDTAISPDGLTIYVATDPGGLAGALDGGTTTTLQNPGAILAFTYRGADAAESPADTPAAAAPSNAPETIAAGEPPAFTAAQAIRGKAIYDANCVSCHGQNLVSASYGTPLAGPYFDEKWRGRSVAELYAYAHERMPPSRPGALPAENYADIVAYILAVNDVRPGPSELLPDAAGLAPMRIPPRQ